MLLNFGLQTRPWNAIHWSVVLTGWVSACCAFRCLEWATCVALSVPREWLALNGIARSLGEDGEDTTGRRMTVELTRSLRRTMVHSEVCSRSRAAARSTI